jgi:PEP-CTERM motif
MLSPVSYKKMIGVVMPKLFSWLSVCVVLLSGTVVQAEVWRVRQNYTDEGKNLTLANMPDYIEPAAAAANAVFGGTSSNDTWNAWDVDARNGNKGGWNYIQGVKTSPWSDGGSGYSTLYDGTGTGNPVQIRSISGSAQHNPWGGLPTTGSGFGQLVGGTHSAGTNGGGAYSVQIDSLTPGSTFYFYSYAHNVGVNSGHGPYLVNLDGATSTSVAPSLYSEGDVASGVLLSGIVPLSGSVVVNYSQAGMTGPAFQFATVTPVPEPSAFVLAGLGLVGLSFGALRKRKR